MANPKFIEEVSLSLVETKLALNVIEKRDKEIGFLTTKAKEYLDAFVTLSESKQKELQKKLEDLDLTRLKSEHISKIADFLPKTVNDLKVVLQAYPLSLPKKDQDAIIAVVKDFA
jgi:DNA-directed RNA polymerase subunit F